MTTSINISSCFEKPQQALSSAFVRRNVDAFKYALETLKADPNDVDYRTKIPLFHHILQTENTAAFINLCIDYGADMYEKDADGRYPLHYVIDSFSPQNLRAFLSRYDSSKINVKWGHRNSLHLLLESILKVDYENGAECVKILVENGCDVNMPNEKSRTPFFMLLQAQPKLRDKNDLVDFIMKHSEVDLYTYKSKQMVEMFTKNNPQHSLPEHVETVINYDYLTSLLRQGDQSKFCSLFRVFKENETNRQKLEENRENKSNDFAEKCSKLLYTAVQNNLEDVVEYLIDSENPNVNKKPEDAVLPPAHLACSQGNHRILKALFRAEPKPNPVSANKQNLLHITAKHFGMDPNKNPSFNYEKCFHIVLDHCDVNQQDDIGFTPLHYAARYRNDEAVVALLKKGSYIGTKGFNGETPVDNMSKKSLEEFLNGCITTNERRYGDEEQEIMIDYNFLMAPKRDGEEFGPEIAPLQNIAEHSELRPLIRHPVLSSFLFLKWSKLSLVFHANLIMFSVFMVSLIWYIVLSQSLSPEEQTDSKLFLLMKVLAGICVIILPLRELFQLILSRVNYVKNPINLFEIVLIILGIYLLFANHQDNDGTTLRILRAVTILFAAYEFLSLIGKLPYLSISTHMVILKKVALTFFKSLLLYSILLLSFALSFYCLFGGKADEEESSTDGATNGEETKKNDQEEKSAFNSFGYPGIAIIKTFVMLTGEFDASDMSLEDHASYSIIFLLFVFLITIVLFNLLNALAIDDTQQIRVEGELIDLCERIHELHNNERIVLSSPYKGFKKFISVFPYTIPFGRIVIHPDKNNEILTYKSRGKSALNNGDVETALKRDQHELQYLNNNISLARFIRGQGFSDSLEKYSQAIDPKIMKSIRIVLEERRDEENNAQAMLLNRMSSMESELTMLRCTIRELTDLIQRKN